MNAAAAPYVAMLLVQLTYGCSNILTKIALDRGLNQFVFLAYRHLLGALLLGPFAYALERYACPVPNSLLYIRVSAFHVPVLVPYSEDIKKRDLSV